MFAQGGARHESGTARADGRELLRLADEIPIRTHTQFYRLKEANQAPAALKRGEIQGTAVFELREI